MKTNQTPGTKQGQLRGPEFGNILWGYYLGLSQLVSLEFRNQYRAHGLGSQGWRADSRLGKLLGDIPTGRFMFYREFFLAHGGRDLLDDFHAEQPTPASLTAGEQYDHNERA